MSISFNSNRAALTLQRYMDRTTFQLSKSYERLATGLRINRASDDAAGLAISSALSVDSRVLNQASRNVNDAINYFRVADGSLRELGDVATRLKELAGQAANGVYSSSQRKALDDEAKSLTAEFNRIVESATFNGRMVLQGTTEQLSIQNGLSSISFSLNDGLERNVGTGTWQNGVSFTNFRAQIAGDFNGDGRIDIAGVGNSGVGIGYVLKKEDGTFTAELTQIGGVSVNSAAGADLNKDGRMDIVAFSTTSGTFQAYLAGGNGTFTPAAMFSVGGAINTGSMQFADLDNDGDNDMIAMLTDGTISLLRNDGSGTFGTMGTISESANSSLAIGDVNNDGRADLIVSRTGSSGTLRTYLGSGSFTFSAPLADSYFTGLTATGVDVADFNGDGKLDILQNAQTAFSASALYAVRLGNGDGTYQSPTAQSLLVPSSRGNAVDLNNDGILDLISNNTGISAYLGNGDGTFTTQTGTQFNKPNGVFADFNDDGVIDGISSPGGPFSGLRFQDTRKSTTMQRYFLTSVEGARNAITEIDKVLARVQTEVGLVGSYLSRLEVGGAVSEVASINFQDAASRIVDADVATEAAELVRNKILQQAGAAIAAQANVLPEIGLRLLQGSKQQK